MKPFSIPTFCFLLLPCFLLIQCEKEDKPYKPVKPCTAITENPDSIQLLAQGTWNWVEDKVTGRSGETNYYTPKTEGYTLQLKLSGDKATFYKNHIPSLFYRFRIMREKDITNWPEDNDPVLVTYELDTGERHR